MLHCMLQKCTLARSDSFGITGDCVLVTVVCVFSYLRSCTLSYIEHCVCLSVYTHRLSWHMMERNRDQSGQRVIKQGILSKRQRGLKASSLKKLKFQERHFKLSKKALRYYCGEKVCESLSLHVSSEQFPNWRAEKQSGLTQNHVLEIAGIAQKCNKSMYILQVYTPKFEILEFSAAPETHFKSILMGGKINICGLDHFTSEPFNFYPPRSHL